MTDRRRHHGAHPGDSEIFAGEQLARLRLALEDFALLLSKGYARESSLKLVGDKFALRARQRTALGRAVATPADIVGRKEKESVSIEGEHEVLIDGYNLINTLECALGGAVVVKCMDGCYRDLAGIHGNYRVLDDSPKAVNLLLQAAASTGIRSCKLLLDAPVSNSGRLKKLIEDSLGSVPVDIEVVLAADPDKLLSAATGPVASSDSIVLDRCMRWFNLTRLIIEESVPEAWVIDLSLRD